MRIINNDRIFTGVESPVLEIRTGFLTFPDSTLAYSISGGELDPPKVRELFFIKDETVHEYARTGIKNTWIKHVHARGSLVFDKITWTGAQHISQAYEFEKSRSTSEVGVGESGLFLWLFGKEVEHGGDPFALEIRITGELNFKHFRLQGHQHTFEFETTKPIDYDRLKITDWYRASSNDEYLYWVRPTA